MKVLKGGRLIDGTGAGPVTGATVVICDQRIEAVTTKAVGEWPDDAEVIDISGMTILPGLIDCHDHMAMHGYGLAQRWGIDEPQSTRTLRTAKVLRETLAAGYTAVRDAAGLDAGFKRAIEEGFARAGNGKLWDSFAFDALVGVTVTDDVKEALRAAKPPIALYVGGMGHPTVNFHKRAMEQQGYGEAAARIEELFRAGRKAEAADAVPDEFVDEQALVGTPNRIRERYRAWADCGITGLHIGTRQAAAVELMAEIALTDQPASLAG